MSDPQASAEPSIDVSARAIRSKIFAIENELKCSQIQLDHDRTAEALEATTRALIHCKALVTMIEEHRDRFGSAE